VGICGVKDGGVVKEEGDREAV